MRITESQLRRVIREFVLQEEGERIPGVDRAKLQILTFFRNRRNLNFVRLTNLSFRGTSPEAFDAAMNELVGSGAIINDGAGSYNMNDVKLANAMYEELSSRSR